MSRVGRRLAAWLARQSRRSTTLQEYGAFWRETRERLCVLRVTDAGLVFEAINPAYEQYGGLKRAETVGRPVEAVLPREVAALMCSHAAECLLAGEPVTYAETESVLGARRNWETTLTPLHRVGGAIQTIVSSSRDVTGRVGAQADRVEINAMRRGAGPGAPGPLAEEMWRIKLALEHASEQLLTVQEEERHRIAIELHDSTSQHLVAIGMGVSRLRRMLGVAGLAPKVLNEMEASLGEAVKEIRVLSYLMNPPKLKQDGLETTVRRFLRGFGARTGLHVAFRAEGDLNGLEAEVQHAIFRIVQESLSNVYRHAKAQGVEVDLTHRAGLLRLRLADDGVGLGPLGLEDAAGVQLGVGVPGMRARVAQFGGTLDIASDAAGTVVQASIPLGYAWRAPGAPARGGFAAGAMSAARGAAPAAPC